MNRFLVILAISNVSSSWASLRVEGDVLSAAEVILLGLFNTIFRNPNEILRLTSQAPFAQNDAEMELFC